MQKKPPAIISVHDVMPHTLTKVAGILSGVLAEVEPRCITLLVVPGLPWQAEQIEQLRQWQQAGYELAGHGWVHQVKYIKTPHHWLHSLFISRRAAEHLSQSAEQLMALIERNFQWFENHQFLTPCLYVPPAWAMGVLNSNQLNALPFQCYEHSLGLRMVKQGRQRCLPLVGFEADTKMRVFFLRYWNELNYRMANTKRPLRLSIHPDDTIFGLAEQLAAMVQACRPVHWQQVFEMPAARNATKVTKHRQNPDEYSNC